MISLAETLSFMLTSVCTTNSQINREHSGCLARLRCGARLSGSWRVENRKIADPSRYCPPTWVFVHGGCLPDNVSYRNEFIPTCPNRCLADFGLFLVMMSFAKTSSAFSFNNLGKPDIIVLIGVIRDQDETFGVGMRFWRRTTCHDHCPTNNSSAPSSCQANT